MTYIFQHSEYTDTKCCFIHGGTNACVFFGVKSTGRKRLYPVLIRVRIAWTHLLGIVKYDILRAFCPITPNVEG